MILGKKWAGAMTVCGWTICREYRAWAGRATAGGDARFFEQELFLALGPQGFWNNNPRFNEWQVAQHS